MANQNQWTSRDGNFVDLPLTADVVFEGGDAVCFDRSTGYAVAPSTSADVVFAGWASLDTPAPASGDANGTRNVRVASGRMARGEISITGSGSGDVLAPADLGKTVFVTGKQAFTVVDPGANGVPCGVLYEITTGGVASTTLGTGTILGLGFGLLPLLSGATGQQSTVTALTDNSAGTASNTLAAQTLPQALTDNSGGTPATTIAVISNSANAGSADVGPVQTAIASLANEQEAARTQLAVLRNACASLAEQSNELRTVLASAGLIA